MRSKALVDCSFLILSAAVLLVGQGPAPAVPALPPQTISLPTFTSTATVAGTNYTYTLLGRGDQEDDGIHCTSTTTSVTSSANPVALPHQRIISSTMERPSSGPDFVAFCVITA
jgi:hypothetical protein